MTSSCLRYVTKPSALLKEVEEEGEGSQKEIIVMQRKEEAEQRS